MLPVGFFRGKAHLIMNDAMNNCEETIFEAARQLGREQRQAYLDAACAGEPQMRERIAKLLAVQGDADRFFDQPAPACRLHDPGHGFL